MAIHSFHKCLGQQRLVSLVGQLVKMKFQLFRTSSSPEDCGAHVDWHLPVRVTLQCYAVTDPKRASNFWPYIRNSEVVTGEYPVVRIVYGYKKCKMHNTKFNCGDFLFVFFLFFYFFFFLSGLKQYIQRINKNYLTYINTEDLYKDCNVLNFENLYGTLCIWGTLILDPAERSKRYRWLIFND